MYDNLLNEMIKKNINAADLASKIGISEKKLNNMLEGKARITLHEAREIKKALGTKTLLEQLFS